MINTWIKHSTPECRTIVRAILASHAKEKSGLLTQEIYDLALQEFPDAKGTLRPELCDIPQDFYRTKKEKGKTPIPEPPRVDHPIRSMRYLKRIVLEDMVLRKEVEKFHVSRGATKGDEQAGAELHPHNGKPRAWLWRLLISGTKAPSGRRQKTNNDPSADTPEDRSPHSRTRDAQFLPWQEEQHTQHRSGRGKSHLLTRPNTSWGSRRRDCHFASTSWFHIKRELSASPRTLLSSLDPMVSYFYKTASRPKDVSVIARRMVSRTTKRQPSVPTSETEWYGTVSIPPEPLGGPSTKHTAADVPSPSLSALPSLEIAYEDEEASFGLKRSKKQVAHSAGAAPPSLPQRRQELRSPSHINHEREVGFGLKGYQPPKDPSFFSPPILAHKPIIREEREQSSTESFPQWPGSLSSSQGSSYGRRFGLKTGSGREESKEQHPPISRRDQTSFSDGVVISGGQFGLGHIQPLPTNHMVARHRETNVVPPHMDPSLVPLATRSDGSREQAGVPEDYDLRKEIATRDLGRPFGLRAESRRPAGNGEYKGHPFGLKRPRDQNIFDAGTGVSEEQFRARSHSSNNTSLPPYHEADPASLYTEFSSTSSPALNDGVRQRRVDYEETQAFATRRSQGPVVSRTIAETPRHMGGRGEHHRRLADEEISFGLKRSRTEGRSLVYRASRGEEVDMTLGSKQPEVVPSWTANNLPRRNRWADELAKGRTHVIAPGSWKRMLAGRDDSGPDERLDHRMLSSNRFKNSTPASHQATAPVNGTKGLPDSPRLEYPIRDRKSNSLDGSHLHAWEQATYSLSRRDLHAGLHLLPHRPTSERQTFNILATSAGSCVPSASEEVSWHRELDGRWAYGWSKPVGQQDTALTDYISNIPFSERLRQSRNAITNQITKQLMSYSKPLRSAVGRLPPQSPTGSHPDDLEQGSGPLHGPLIPVPHSATESATPVPRRSQGRLKSYLNTADRRNVP